MTLRYVLLPLCFLACLPACGQDETPSNNRGNLNLDMGRRDASSTGVVNTARNTSGTSSTGRTSATAPLDMNATPRDMSSVAEGAANLVTRMTPEPAGTNCPRGGTKTEQGQDTDQDGILDDNEVQASLTTYQCEADCTMDSFFHTERRTCVPRPRLAAGLSHTCASFADAPVRCWGSNDTGQLGTGTTIDSSTPVRTQALAMGLVRAIASRADHTCAADATGTLYCWGSNFAGQLGVGTTRFSPTPERVLIGTGNTVTSVATGKNHSCAQTAMRGLQCWGSNSQGQLGDDSAKDNTVPVATTGLDGGTSAVVTGDAHACALTTSRQVRCWGDNREGQTAQQGTQRTPTPAQIPGLSAIAQLAAGATHTCALSTGGRVRCWGSNAAGQLGNGNVSGIPSQPVQVEIPQNLKIRAITAGATHTCALTEEGGRMYCWGENAAGQLGIGTNTRQPSPVEITALREETVAIIAGAAHTCAVLATGQMRCWGDNSSGQLGTGMNQDTNVPTNVLGL